MSDATASDVIIFGGGARFDLGFDVVADLLARDAIIESMCILPLAQPLLYAWICEENSEHYHIQKTVIFSLKRRSVKAFPCQPRSPPQ